MKRFKFEFGGMFMFYFGENIGEAIAKMIKDRPNCLKDLTAITEYPIMDDELP